MHYKVLKFWVAGINDRFALTKGFTNISIKNKLSGPVYHITSCFNSTPPLYTWISIIHPDPQCTGIGVSGALVDIVNHGSPMMNQTQTPVLEINNKAFDVLSSYDRIDAEIYDNDGIYNWINSDLWQLLFIYAIIVCVCYRLRICMRNMYRTYKKHKKTKGIKYLLDEPTPCTICIEDIEKNQLYKELPCKHKFHVNCINEWLNKKEICPNCNYTPDETYPLL